MKNLFRMPIHPNLMSAIRDNKVKQLFLNAKPRRLQFGGSERPFLLFLNGLSKSNDYSITDSLY